MIRRTALGLSAFFHPDSSDGVLVFGLLLERFLNSSEIDLDASFKLPIFRVPTTSDNRAWEEFQYFVDESQAVCIVLIIDQCLEQDLSLKSTVESLLAIERRNRSVLVLPVTFQDELQKSWVLDLIGAKNVLRPSAMLREGFGSVNLAMCVENSLEIFFVEFCHSVIRFLCSRILQRNIGKVSVFISHAKRDGLVIARELKRVIESVTQLDDFFDVHDILVGENFRDQIHDAISKDSSLLFFVLTDQYSTREACRYEVLVAKEKQRPIVTIDAIEEIESRSYPYMYNNPVVRWKGNGPRVLKILGLGVREFLRVVVDELRFLIVMETDGDSVDEFILFHPELLHLSRWQINAGARKIRIGHPSPILDSQERDLLSKVAPHLEFVSIVELL